MMQQKFVSPGFLLVTLFTGCLLALSWCGVGGCLVSLLIIKGGLFMLITSLITELSLPKPTPAHTWACTDPVIRRILRQVWAFTATISDKECYCQV